MGPLALIAMLVTFALLALWVHATTEDPERRRVNSVALEYANAWRGGRLDRVQYDQLSNPDVDQGDSDKVADAVRFIVHDLDGTGNLTPETVSVDESQTQLHGGDLANTMLYVTWKLRPTGLDQQGHSWSYWVPLQERRAQGRWRVVWTPQTVHPALRAGLVLRVSRTLPPRATVLGAGDTVLPPQSAPTQAKAVIGSIVAQASQEQAKLNALRVAAGDTVGVAGLQELYDMRLAGNAQIQVAAVSAQGSPPIGVTQAPLYVGPPDTPKPIKVTLDSRTQGLAESALAGMTQPATLVVVRASTGELLAAANTSQTNDYGLWAQQPPGPVFGPTALLALLRAGYSTTTRVNCTSPWTFQGQVFRNVQGPNLDQVTLGAAVEGGCITALARAAGDVTPEALQAAAYDLGTAVPLQPSSQDTPSWLTVSDQLGTPAFHGSVPADTDALKHAEDTVGQGQVLLSPLSLARSMATIASSARRSVRLVVDPAATRPDAVKPLSSAESEALQDVLAKGVTEPGGSAHALASTGGEVPHALAGTGGYGTGPSATTQAWCSGYRGDYAFAVLVPNSPTAQAAAPALTVAANFLRLAG